MLYRSEIIETLNQCHGPLLATVDLTVHGPSTVEHHGQGERGTSLEPVVDLAV